MLRPVLPCLKPASRQYHAQANSLEETGTTMKNHRGNYFLAAALVVLAASLVTHAAKSDDVAAVAALDTKYQAAVKANDAATMDGILAGDFTLVTGSGKAFNKADLLAEARSANTVYEHQDETDQVVRVWGGTAVVTAKLWIKGTRAGKPIDYTLWFSDTYVRTPQGWRYVFGQASLPLPKAG
jgi:ketosteroid isomerase-like protein